MCKGRDQQMRADENGNLLAEVKGREGNSLDGVSTTRMLIGCQNGSATGLLFY